MPGDFVTNITQNYSLFTKDNLHATLSKQIRGLRDVFYLSESFTRVTNIQMIMRDSRNAFEFTFVFKHSSRKRRCDGTPIVIYTVHFHVRVFMLSRALSYLSFFP